MLYVCSPYSHPDPAVREQRFHMACESAGRLMSAGHIVFCPVSHTHPIAVAVELPTGWDFWRKQDEWFVEHCTALVVVMMEGWGQSNGARAELRLAGELGKPIAYVEFGKEVEQLRWTL